jgi:hypothetical protein
MGSTCQDRAKPGASSRNKEADMARAEWSEGGGPERIVENKVRETI